MKNFLIHLRLPYMFGILSAPYLISALFAQTQNWSTFFVQFVNIHALLFGGATAFNSYWDKDDGPVGGLKQPPKMQEWMRPVSMVFMFLGLLFTYSLPVLFHILYLISVLLFWLYSSPIARWKGHPWLSLLTIAVSTGVNSFLMGILALGTYPDVFHFCTAVGVGCMLTAMYPVSQVFQIQEDTLRGDTTFAIKYGLKGIRRLFWVLNGVGVMLICVGLYWVNSYFPVFFTLFSLLPTVIVSKQLKTLSGDSAEYPAVMRLKYMMSFSFVLLSILIIGIKIVLT